ncbi:MAG: aldo/keto reductase [Chloroflexi bacterium]|nr:aldo/keto reductase [Chloroflexota bacterium]
MSPMHYTTLGPTDVRIPEVGLGTWQYRGGVEPLRRGLDLGANLIDTAEVYGTEGVVGEAIKGRRKDVFLATKVSGDHLRHKDVLRAADASLRKLGTDWIDLYQIHWPDSSVPIEETMRAMEELVEAGKVRYIGVSNFSADEQRAAQAALRKHRIVSNQPLYNLADRDIERDLLPYCQREKVTVLAYSPLARGALTSKPRFVGDRGRVETIERITRETGKTKAQVVLNWCLSRPGVIVIPKSDRVHRIEENCGASGWRLAPAQVQALDKAFA